MTKSWTKLTRKICGALDTIQFEKTRWRSLRKAAPHILVAILGQRRQTRVHALHAELDDDETMLSTPEKWDNAVFLTTSHSFRNAMHAGVETATSLNTLWWKANACRQLPGFDLVHPWATEDQVADHMNHDIELQLTLQHTLQQFMKDVNLVLREKGWLKKLTPQLQRLLPLQLPPGSRREEHLHPLQLRPTSLHQALLRPPGRRSEMTKNHAECVVLT